MDKKYFEQHKEKMIYLEKLRRSGITNMFGASPYLQKEFSISKEEAKEVLCFWMDNYDKIIKEI